MDQIKTFSPKLKLSDDWWDIKCHKAANQEKRVSLSVSVEEADTFITCLTGRRFKSPYNTLCTCYIPCIPDLEGDWN